MAGTNGAPLRETLLPLIRLDFLLLGLLLSPIHRFVSREMQRRQMSAVDSRHPSQKRRQIAGSFLMKQSHTRWGKGETSRRELGATKVRYNNRPTPVREHSERRLGESWEHKSSPYWLCVPSVKRTTDGPWWTWIELLAQVNRMSAVR